MAALAAGSCLPHIGKLVRFARREGLGLTAVKQEDGDLPMKKLMLAAAVIACAAPAFAQEATTLQNVTTKGTVIKAEVQGICHFMVV